MKPGSRVAERRQLAEKRLQAFQARLQRNEWLGRAERQQIAADVALVHRGGNPRWAEVFSALLREPS